jgi:O-antigen ligase
VSRFNNVNAVLGPSRNGGAEAAAPTGTSRVQPAAGDPPRGTGVPRKSAANLVLPLNPGDVTLGQKVGFLILCIYMISGYANEFAIRALGAKAYISTVSLAILPIAWVISGNMLRGLRDTMGRLWVGFLVWMCVAVPFSVWKGGSVTLLKDYVSHSWIFFFFIAAFVVSLKHCRWLMGVLIAADVLLLVDCAVTAHTTNGRLDIPGSIFFSNANNLSLQLTLAITQFFYLLFQRGVWQRVLAVVGITTALVYSLQTGSRGGAIAILALVAMIFLIGNQKLLVAAVVLVAGTAAIVIVPSAAFHRISLIAGDEQIVDNADLSAAGSVEQRLALLRQSVEFTITHPLLGVGPGEFAVAVDGEAQKKGERSAWLGTHNSYTEVSSECGIPAFLFYSGIVILCLLSNLRIYQRSVNYPQLRQLSALAFCTFCGSVVFAVATFFYHIAYTSYLPVIAGMTVALRLITDQSLWGSRRVAVVVGSQRGLPGQLSQGAA